MSPVEWWMSTSDPSIRLTAQPILDWVPVSGEEDELAIHVDPSERFQTIEGFGASFTETASYLLRSALTDDQRRKLLEEFVDRERGIGLNFFRQPIGATDISRDYYSYDDMPPDQDDSALQHFSIDPDRDSILPVLKEMLAMSPDATILATPWSPPAWMRTDRSMRGNSGGQLRPEAYASYAEYLARFVEGYADEGVVVRYMTVQNEPLYQPHYPGMLMPARQQAEFIGEYLGPTFESRGIATKILTHDHNWDDLEYALEVLRDPIASPYVAGSAFHRYSGNAGAQSTVHEEFPDKGIYFTEGSTDSTISLPFIVGTVMIDSLRNWAKCIILWNLVADQGNGPYMRPGGCAICRPVTNVDTTTGTWKHNDDYYALGHLSKFVRPGATRIGSTQNVYSTEPNVAVQNPDGSIVLLVLNQGVTDQNTVVTAGGQQFTAWMPAGACATFVWQPEPSSIPSHQSTTNR